MRPLQRAWRPLARSAGTPAGGTGDRDVRGREPGRDGKRGHDQARRRRPKRAPLPADLPRDRVVIPGPEACPCCGSADLVKLGEDVTETLEVVTRQGKIVQTVREKFSCRGCETITQPPATHHAIPRARTGPGLLAIIVRDKFAMHPPLTRQSRAMAAEGIEIDVSTLADWRRQDRGASGAA